MKKVFGLMMVLALAGLVSCGEAVVETPAEPTTINVEAPSVEVETPVMGDTMTEETMDETPVMGDTMTEETMDETPVVDETVTPSAE